MQRDSTQKCRNLQSFNVFLFYTPSFRSLPQTRRLWVLQLTMTLGGDHLPALVGWYAASVGNNYATPSLLHFLGDRPLPLNVLEQAML